MKWVSHDLLIVCALPRVCSKAGYRRRPVCTTAYTCGDFDRCISIFKRRQPNSLAEAFPPSSLGCPEGGQKDAAVLQIGSNRKLTLPTLQLSMWVASILYSSFFSVEKNVNCERPEGASHSCDSSHEVMPQPAKPGADLMCGSCVVLVGAAAREV